MDYADVNAKIAAGTVRGAEESADSGTITVVINTPKAINKIGADSFPVRRAAIERNLPVLTCMNHISAASSLARPRQM